MVSSVIDLLITVLVAIQILCGMRRGFVLGMLDLIGWIVALAIALILVTPATNLLLRFIALPRGIAGLAVALLLLFITMSVFALAVHQFYRLINRRLAQGNLAWIDRVLGIVPGAINGVIVAGLLLELLLLAPINASLDAAVLSARLARPLANAALEIGKPFALLAQEAALDVNGYLTKKLGEPPVRLTLPVTDLSLDEAAEKRMLELVNAERVQRGLSPLVMEARLTQVARQHSEEMLKMHYFAHDSPVLGTPFERMVRAGIRFRVAGENLALAPNVERAHTGLMNSPEHRENILRPEFRKVGIGAVNGGLSGVMFTQDFTD